MTVRHRLVGLVVLHRAYGDTEGFRELTLREAGLGPRPTDALAYTLNGFDIAIYSEDPFVFTA